MFPSDVPAGGQCPPSGSLAASSFGAIERYMRPVTPTIHAMRPRERLPKIVSSASAHAKQRLSTKKGLQPMKTTPTDRPKNRGQFRRGFDPRRYRFTRAECQAGFWAAINSIIIRYPDATDSSGRHIAFDFLKVAGRHNNANGSKQKEALAQKFAQTTPGRKEQAL